MAQVFISYAREDRPDAQALAEALAAHGLTVWCDLYLPVGRVFAETIERELDAAACVIVLWSRHAVASDWVKAEAAEGAARRILVPVLLEQVRVPLEFRRIHAANLIGWNRDPRHPEAVACIQAARSLVGGTTVSPVAAGSNAGAAPIRGRRRIASFAVAIVALLATMAILGNALLNSSSNGQTDTTATTDPVTTSTNNDVDPRRIVVKVESGNLRTIRVSVDASALILKSGESQLTVMPGTHKLGWSATGPPGVQFTIRVLRHGSNELVGLTQKIPASGFDAGATTFTVE